MSLQKYHQKRNFKATSEPIGKNNKNIKKNNTFLYLIQKHAASHLHYDLRLELNGTLKSWAVPKGPSLDPDLKRLAVHVEDHPMEYGSFEGIIPAGEYGGGTVMLWDTGTWKCEDENAKQAYKKGSLTFSLEGKKLKGLWKLIRLKNDPKNWLLIKINDKYARSNNDYNILEKKPNIVISHKKNKMPTIIYPELATLQDKPPKGNEWLHEIKFDGYRILCFIKNNNIKLITRNQNDWTHKFPELVKAIKKLKIESAIFDGELVALNSDQHSDFQLLQNAIHDNKTNKLIYYIFDLLYLNNINLFNLPLHERKYLLQKLIPANNKIINYSDHIIGQGEIFFKQSCKFALEGIVSKKIHSVYLQKRTQDWIKTKCIKRQEFLIIGFTQPKGKRDYFGSLLLAVYGKNKILQYCGNVGTGFTHASLKIINKLLQKYKTSTMQLPRKPTGFGPITWVKPILMAEIEFTEWTKDGALRHPSFKGIRNDKNPSDIKREESKKIHGNH